MHEGAWLVGTRTLDIRRGVLLAALVHRPEAGITVTEHELRLLSLADRAAGLQLQRFSINRDGVEVQIEAIFGLAGLGMEPLLLEEDLGSWRTEGSGKSVAMMGTAALRLGCELLASVPAAMGVAMALHRESGGRARPARRGGVR